ELAAFCRPPAETAGARGLPELPQHRRHLDAVPRDDRRDGPLGDDRRRTTREPDSAPRRRHTGRGRGMAAAVPGDPGRGGAARTERATAVGFRTGGGTWDPEGTPGDRDGRRLYGPGAGGRRGRQR